MFIRKSEFGGKYWLEKFVCVFSLYGVFGVEGSLLGYEEFREREVGKDFNEVGSYGG